MDCLNNILIGASWLIEKLNQYNGLLLVILTIIGFWFICKQIAIAKNKDIFFRFQTELMQEINFYLNRNETFRNKLNELIDKYSKVRTIGTVTTSEPDLQVNDDFLDELGKLSTKYLSYYCMNNIPGYYWWLDSYNEKIETIQNSSEYKEIKKYINKITEYIYNKPSNIINIIEFYDYLKEYDNQISGNKNILYSDLKELLNELAKEKKVL
ncbi:hypothetical protein [Gilliamella sp. B2838]|uniref:hypothetical protein n=1 Tax=Gilliamella sp. B2838 TaxID=2818020 RepID=UPI002269F6F2|nr:hypothetical protein [Gilliamella sp. B2838]MCX8727190.1 hypothetical protein [Gilliamella sp. B2838]